MKSVFYVSVDEDFNFNIISGTGNLWILPTISNKEECFCHIFDSNATEVTTSSSNISISTTVSTSHKSTIISTTTSKSKTTNSKITNISTSTISTNTTNSTTKKQLQPTTTTTASTTYGTNTVKIGLLSGGYSLNEGVQGALYGGQDYHQVTTVDTMGGDCSVADLPFHRRLHVSFVTRDNLVMVCGGAGSGEVLGAGPGQDSLGNDALASCQHYNLAEERWDNHSNFRTPRSYAAVASLEDRVYVFGGTNSKATFGTVLDPTGMLDSTEVLLPGSKNWTSGPKLPVKLSFACAVAVTDSTMLLIGGLTPTSHPIAGVINLPISTVWMYSSQTETWSQWPSLAGPRLGHACIKAGNSVVVAGGGRQAEGLKLELVVLKTTEIINLKTKEVRPAGDMKTPRFLFGIFEIGYKGQTIKLTFGSYSLDNSTYGINESNFNPALEVYDEDSLLQEWDNTKEDWLQSPAVLNPKFGFSVLSVDASLVCKPGEIEEEFIQNNKNIEFHYVTFQPTSPHPWKGLFLVSAKTGSSTPPEVTL